MLIGSGFDNLSFFIYFWALQVGEEEISPKIVWILDLKFILDFDNYLHWFFPYIFHKIYIKKLRLVIEFPDFRNLILFHLKFSVRDRTFSGCENEAIKVELLTDW